MEWYERGVEAKPKQEILQSNTNRELLIEEGLY